MQPSCYMITKNISLPVYLKLSIIITGICGFGFLLYVGQGILLPLGYAFLFSILLEPMVVFFRRYKWPPVVAISVSILIAIMVMLGIIYFITYELASFSSALPLLKQKSTLLVTQAESWASHEFHISTLQVRTYLLKIEQSAIDSSDRLIGQTVSTVSGMLVVVFLIPVYTFMILYYKSLLLSFIEKVFDKTRHTTVGEVLVKSKKMIQSYLVGLLLEAAIVATLNSTGLLLIGIDYAILLGITGALLNIIPFIGGILAVSFPVFIALITKDSLTPAILVMVLYLVIQFIDNHFIIPKLVASRVKINALASLVVVLMAGALWGIAGMFIAIPLTAIIKIIFDRIEPLKPWGFLLGDDMPAAFSFLKVFRLKRDSNSKTG